MGGNRYKSALIIVEVGEKQTRSYELPFTPFFVAFQATDGNNWVGIIHDTETSPTIGTFGGIDNGTMYGGIESGYITIGEKEVSIVNKLTTTHLIGRLYIIGRNAK